MQVFEGPTESSRQCLIAVYNVEEPVGEYAFQVLVVLVAAGGLEHVCYGADHGRSSSLLIK